MTDRLLLVGMMAVGRPPSESSALRNSVVIPRFRCPTFGRDGPYGSGDLRQRGDEALRTWRVTCSPRRSPSPFRRDRGRRRRRSLRGQSIVAGALRRRRMATRDDRHAERTSRTRGSETRLGADPAQSLRDLYLTRHPLYASVADSSSTSMIYRPKKWSRASSTTPVWVTSSSRA